MKRSLIVLVALLVSVMPAFAEVELLTNGDFNIGFTHQFDQGGWPEGWGGYGYQYGGWQHADAGFVEGDFGITIYNNGTGVTQAVAVEAGEIIKCSGKMIRPGVDPYGELLNEFREGIIRIEYWSAPFPDGVMIEPYDVGVMTSADDVDTWYEYSKVTAVPEGATEARITCTVEDIADGGEGKVYFDTISAAIAGAGSASNPVPGVGDVVSPDLDELSWTLPEPNVPGGTVVCDVWISSYDAPSDDPNFDAENPTAVQLVSGEAVSSVVLSTKGVDIEQDKFYYWQVICTDSTSGLTEGFIWSFNTGDRTPVVVSAGQDQYVWLDMADGDGDDTKVTFSLAGIIDDDNKSPVTYEWTLNYSETDPATIIDIKTPDQAATEVTIDNTGWYQFLLVAEDAIGSGENIVHVGVYDSACTAAKADPADMYNSALNGDIDGDCDVDLEDLQIIAGTWLGCLSDKLDCAIIIVE